MKRIKEKLEQLTTENIKENAMLICKANPDWGRFRVLRKYDIGKWEVRGESGDGVLFEKEFKFWDIVGGKIMKYNIILEGTVIGTLEPQRNGVNTEEDIFKIKDTLVDAGKWESFYWWAESQAARNMEQAEFVAWLFTPGRFQTLFSLYQTT